MKKGRRWLFLRLVLAGLAAALLSYALLGEAIVIEHYVWVSRRPRIRPDYTDTVIPPNIAPLNFCVEEPGGKYYVKIHSSHGPAIELCATGPRIAIPPREWKALLSQNRGRQIGFDVYAQGEDGSWRRFETITNTIADEDIDPYIVYRIHNVLYNYHLRMKMYERSVENYGESLILDSRSFGHGCMNCHTFWQRSTDRMIVHVRRGREDFGSGMLLIQDGVVSKIDTRTQFSPGFAAFASWHPSGRVLAFSVNKVRQFFHSARPEVREGIDLKSDLALYVLDSKTVTSTAAISRPDCLETWPEWSADGSCLYFSSAPMPWPADAESPPPHYDEARYDLMRIGYDIESGAWGELDTVLSVQQTGLSITLPRCSPDGRFLLFCMSEYSGFPALQPDSDLYLMDLATGEYSRLACNSDQADSWHSWSSNSRWIAFSSKKGDALFMKVHFSYIDRDGNAHKPFVLPQKDPGFYDSFFRVYHVPEFSTDPIPVRGEEIARVIRSAAWSRVGLPVTSATPGASVQNQ